MGYADSSSQVDPAFWWCVKGWPIAADQEDVDRLLQGFNDWMNGGGTLILIAGCVTAALLAPALVLVHELGHATVGLVRTEGLVKVRVGRSPARWRLRLGRLDLELNPVPARNAPAGLAMMYARFGVGTKVALALAGPLAQAGAAGLVLLFGLHEHSTLLATVGVLWLIEAALNLVPRERNGLRSDGAYLLDALRGARAAPRVALNGSTTAPFMQSLADTYSRWLVLFSDPNSAVKTARRARLLGGAPVALGYGPDDQSTIPLGLWRLAFAGWCWREVEHGEPERLREVALDAVHTATRSGAFEPNLTALAARSLATSAAELGLASPGANDAERKAFLAAAFRQVPTALRPAVIPEQQQRFAFRYGVALHDVERAHSY